jgi:hypothetical protein
MRAKQQNIAAAVVLGFVAIVALVTLARMAGWL